MTCTPAKPCPDPAPAAVQAGNHRARIDWAYGQQVWFRGRRYWCWVPVHYAATCTDQSGRHA